MKVAFRADASTQIGSGHLMRCLTLAQALRDKGADCHFISRAHPGGMIEGIRDKGFDVTALPVGESGDVPPQHNDPVQLAHAAWLGCDWQTDAEQTSAAIQTRGFEWLVVDHYALDIRWEQVLQNHIGRLMVIDDLADRDHDCDLLLDQTLGRARQAYASRVPGRCKLLLGSEYALLRPEFAALRDYSLKRRARAARPTLERILVTMGGVDQPNATGRVLKALKDAELPGTCKITVVLGAGSPWLEQVQLLASAMRWPTEVRVDVSDMAQIMADSDLCIGAAGSTAWERCCLGVPALMVVLGLNQQAIAAALDKASVAVNLGDPASAGFDDLLCQAMTTLIHSESKLISMSNEAAGVTEGCGANILVNELMSKW